MATTSYGGNLKNEEERKENNASEAGKFKKEEGKEENQMFECNICLDTAKDAVVSMCGHLFCWPCLHQWLETRPTRQLCPVCKAAISREKVVPLYGRGRDNTRDPRDKVPPRPAGQRTEPENNNTYPGFGFGDGGFHMSFGMAFPFGFVQSTWQSAAQAAENTHHPQGIQVPRPEDEALSKVFFFLAVTVIIWLLFN